VSSVLAMLYGVGSKDALSFITSHPLRDTPGTKFAYSTGDSTLLAAVVRSALEAKHGEEYAWKLLYDVIGMTTVVQERDSKGNPLGGTNLYATARDYARFGFLYLNDGCWDSQRLLPEDWVTRSTVPSPAFRAVSPGAEPNGWQWWLNVRVPEQGVTELPWKEMPEGSYAANGHWGQYIIVVPSLDLVVVRLGDDRSTSMDLSRLVELVKGVAK
jgi:CubicO group peptidase (beta-lactamase class C family)